MFPEATPATLRYFTCLAFAVFIGATFAPPATADALPGIADDYATPGLVNWVDSIDFNWNPAYFAKRKPVHLRCKSLSRAGIWWAIATDVYDNE